jgi:hypothetical protein
MQPSPVAATAAVKLQKRYVLLGIALISTIVVAAMRLAVMLRFDLLIDEALYAWLGMRHELTLAPHPPGVPLMVRGMTDWFGRTEWAVRLPSFLMMLSAPWLIFLLLCRMGLRAVAPWIIVVLNVLPIFVGFGTIATPDAPQLFFWCVLLLVTYQALESKRTTSWILVGATLGLALAFKYVIVLYVPSLLLCLLITPPWRAHFKRPGAYIAAAITAAMLLLLVWAAGIGSTMDALRYHLKERQHWSEAFDYRNIATYQFAHLAYISPILYLLAIVSIALCSWQGWRKNDRHLLFAFAFSVVMLLFFAVISTFTGRRLTREHWDAPAYVPAFMGTIILFQRASTVTACRLRIWTKAGVVVAALISIAMLTEGMTGRISAFLNAKPPFSSFRGWRVLSEHLDQQIETLPAAQPRYLLARTFQPMIEYAFYGRATRDLYKLDDKLDEKWGVAGEFVRGQVTWRDLAAQTGANMIFVREEFGRSKMPIDPWLPWLQHAFTNVRELKPFTVEEHGYVYRDYRIYECLDLKDAGALASPP